MAVQLQRREEQRHNVACKALACPVTMPIHETTSRPLPAGSAMRPLRKLRLWSTPRRPIPVQARGHGGLRGELSGQQRKKKSSMAIECLMDDSDRSHNQGQLCGLTNSLSVSDVCRKKAEGRRDILCDM